MKVKRLRIISLISVIVLVFSFVGCGEKQNPQTSPTETETVLDIIAPDKGFGVNWLKNVKDGFMAKNPGITVNLKTPKLDDKVNMYLTTKKSNPYDIIFTEGSAVFGYAETPYTIAGVERCYENLMDVYNTVPDGETKTIKEKMYNGLYDYFKSTDTEVYSMPWAMTLFGLMYNTDLISADEIPNTTDELIKLCQKIETENKGVNAVVWTKDGFYFEEVFETWWAQYQGKQEFMNYFTSEDINVLKQTGRLRALEVLSSLIDYDKGYADSDSPGLEYIPAQQRLMEGKSAIYPCGAWLENEMSEFFAPGTAPVDYMRTPVISAIVETLEYRDNQDYMSDPMLSAIITAIDEGKTSYQGVSTSDFNIIKNARMMYYYENIIDNAVIPSFANAKTLAKKFLVYLYSNEGIELYTKANSGGSLPVYYDYGELSKDFSTMQKTRLDIMGKECNYLYRPRHRSIASFDFYNTNLQNALGGISGTMTPQEMIDYTFNYYNNNNQSQWKILLNKKK